jgi:hypothetical protein
LYSKGSKQPRDQRWATRLENGRQTRDRYSAEFEENRRLLVGRVRGSKSKKQSLSKLGWASFQTMIGAIYAQNPSPIIREENAELENTARQLTQIVRMDLNQMNSRYVTRLAAQDVFWAGFGIVMERLDQQIAIDGSGLPSPKNQQYSLHRIHPNAFIPDPKGVTPDMVDHKWAAIEIYPSVADLKSDKDFKFNMDVMNNFQLLKGAPQSQNYPQANKWTNSPANFAGDSDEPDEFKIARVQEIWDKQNKRLLYQPTGSDAIIGEKDWPVEPYFKGDLLFPWVVLYFNESPDEFWPVPELTMIAEEINQYSVLRRAMLMDAVTKWRKFLIRGDLVQKGHIDRLTTGPSNSVISVDARNVPATQQLRLQDVVQAIPDPAIKNDVLIAMNQVKQDIHETVGAGDFASAGFRNTRSATEAAALSDFLKARMTTRTESIDSYFKKLSRLHVLFLQGTATEARYMKLTDEHGIDAWKSFTKDDIQGEFHFDVIAGTSMPKNTDSVRERNMALYQQLAPMVQQSGGNVQPLIEWIAPFYDVPQHIIDLSFAGHKQALQNLALLFMAAHAGARIQGAQVMEAIASAVNSGLNAQDMQKIQQMGAQLAQQQQSHGGGGGGAAGAPPGLGGPQMAPAQPGGLPGTNTSPQLR